MFFRKMSSLVVLSVAVIGLSGCGGASGDGVGSIDLADYMPAENMDKHYEYTSKDADGAFTRDGTEEQVTVSTVDGHKVVIQREGLSWKKSIVYDDNISTFNRANDLTDVTKRYADVGDTIMFLQDSFFIDGDRMEFTYECMVDEKINSLLEKEDGTSLFTGDMLKIKCSMSVDDYVETIGGVDYSYYNTRYYVMKKDKGLVADLDLDCYINPANDMMVNDSHLDTCPEDQLGFSMKIWYDE